MEPRAEGPRARRMAVLGLAGAVLLLAWHLASFDLARLPIVSDVRFYLYFAWRVSEGAVPHRDFFDHKTQLASLLGALFYRSGASLGVDPLLAIRCGYLALAGAGGLLLYGVQRRLAPPSLLSGWCGVLAYASFGLLGLLPATGCVPKLVAALCASAIGLLAQRGRWLTAGALGALAAFDWQIGALAWLAALVTAWFCAEARVTAVRRVVLGGLLGAAPFLLYFALTGALGDFLTQAVGGSLDRSAGTQSRDTFGARLGRIQQLIASDCPGRAWLAYASLVGVPVALAWFVRHKEQRALLLPPCLFHAGITAFSLFDFQWHADLFILLHGLAFWQALLWNGLWKVLAPRLHRSGARAAGASAVLLLVSWVARPGALRPDLALETPQISPRATLDDQREIAARVSERFGSSEVAFLESSELLFLARRVNPLPTVFWNDASWRHLRRDEESKDETLRRLLLAAGVRAYVTTRPLQVDANPPRIERLASRSGQYFVILQER